MKQIHVVSHFDCRKIIEKRFRLVRDTINQLSYLVGVFRLRRIVFEPVRDVFPPYRDIQGYDM